VICTDTSIDTYTTERLEQVKQLESKYDTPNFEIHGIESSPCGRMLMEFQKTRLVIRDTISFNEAFKVGGEARKLVNSTDFLIFTGKNEMDEEQICILNFMHNVKCNRV